MGKTKISGVLLLVVILQTIAIIWLVYDRLNQKEVNQVLVTKIEKTEDEKSGVEQELKNMLEQYENMKTGNKELNEKLSEEQAKIQKLIDELRYVKRSNRMRIKELESETETLRNIMKSFVRQIDSLNTRNNILRKEKKIIRNKYESEVVEKENIISERDSLSGTVKKAQKLKTYNFEAIVLNNRDKKTVRAKKMQKAEVCFLLGENEIARKEYKNVYMRIAAPNGMILMNKESGMFEYQGKEIAYSSKRKVNYKGETMNVCIYWTAEDRQATGKYTINVFVDGYDIGETSFVLK